MDRLQRMEYKLSLRDLLEDQKVEENNVKICRVKSSTKVWHYSGIIEIKVLKLNYDEEIIKIEYLSTLPEHFKQGDVVWLDFNRCDIFEVINI